MRRQLRESPVDLPRLTGEHIDARLRDTTVASALGVDLWAIGELRALPLEAKQELADCTLEMESTMTVPAQVLIATVALLGHIAGGLRPIGLLAQFIRLRAKLRRAPVTQWEERHAGHWDAALKRGHRVKSSAAARGDGRSNAR